MSEENLLLLAEQSMSGFDAESLSEQLEQESRRYSRRLSEEEEERLR